MAYPKYLRRQSRYVGRGSSYGRSSYARSRSFPTLRYTRNKTTKSKGSDQATVYMKPFSTATTNPKIPDSKCRLSAGIRLQSVKEWVNDDQNSTMDFLFFPGLNNSIYAQGVSTTGSTTDAPYSAHGGFVLANDVYSQTDSAVAMWRQVSLGIKFTLTNNSDENDGWFEAIRFASSRSDNHFTVATGQDPLQSPGVITALPPNNAGSLPVLGITQGDAGSAGLVEHPSYITGKLRDIHRYWFGLSPHNTDHDFQHVKSSYSIAPGTSVADTTDFIHDLIDHSYDMVFIRVHGRSGTETPTRLMTHIVSNQEIVYEQGSALSRFHTETDSVPYFESMARKKVQASVKAGTRQGTSRMAVSRE